MKYYDIETINNVINKYYESDGYVVEVIEGVLGFGTTICYGDGLKTCVIQEHYLNEWSSGNTIRFYHKTPKKYEVMIDEYYEREEK